MNKVRGKIGKQYWYPPRNDAEMEILRGAYGQWPQQIVVHPDNEQAIRDMFGIPDGSDIVVVDSRDIFKFTIEMQFPVQQGDNDE